MSDTSAHPPVEPSDDELISLARDAGNLPGVGDIERRLKRLDPALSLSERCYVYGVITERKRARAEAAAVRSLAVKLACAIAELRTDILSDDESDVVWVDGNYELVTPGVDLDSLPSAWCLTPRQISRGRAGLLLADARIAGLLDGE